MLRSTLIALVGIAIGLLRRLSVAARCGADHRIDQHSD